MPNLRAIIALTATPILLAALTGCQSGPVEVSGTVGPAGVASSSTTTEGPSAPASTATSTATSTGTTTAANVSDGAGSSAGCGKKAGLPAGAKPVATADLDDDGRPDKLWLADQGGKRLIGVSTAAGGVTWASFTSAAPQAATATADRLGDGTVVILVDPGRIVQLFAYVDCIIVPSINAQGHQYTFDTGFTGYGTGAGCPVVGGGRVLAGYLAKGQKNGGGPYTVTRTTIGLDDSGRRASNGVVTTLGKNLSASSSIVKTAQTVACGSNAPAREPQS